MLLLLLLSLLLFGRLVGRGGERRVSAIILVVVVVVGLANNGANLRRCNFDLIAPVAKFLQLAVMRLAAAEWDTSDVSRMQLAGLDLVAISWGRV